MLRLSTCRCAYWDPTPLARAFNLPWQPSRTAATLQKRKPSRMVLSEKVAQGPPRTTSSARPVRRTRNSPFAGMNKTVVPRDVEAARNTISAAERRRQERSLKKRGQSKKEEKERDPMRALKMQQRLTNVSYEKRSRVKQQILERDSFDEFDLLPAVQESISSQALSGLVDVSPTPIQRLAIPSLLDMPDGKRRKKGKLAPERSKEMQSYLLAAETGSGKTLAYVLPILDAIKRAEVVEAEQQAMEAAEKEERERERGPTLELDSPVDEHSSAGRPRAIILLPTSELVSQVGALIKSLSHTVKFRAALISASFSGTVIRNRLFSPAGVDVVVATPHLISSIAETDPNILSRVSHLVIDEADSLLDRSFSPITSAIIDRASPSLRQLVFCSATIPKSMDSYLNKRYPDTKRLSTPNLHAIPRRVQLTVVDIDKVPYQGNRDLACAQTIWDIGKEAVEAGEGREKKIVVFVNEREQTIELANYLRSKGIDAHALSRDSEDRKQAEILAAFTGAVSHSSTRPSTELQQPAIQRPPTADSPSELAEYVPYGSEPKIRRLENTKVLVMTDIGSRGIDTLLVKHVVLYDVPHTSIDFIHRLGRVGRMGRRGRGIVLVGKHDRKDVVREVRDGMFKGQALI